MTLRQEKKEKFKAQSQKNTTSLVIIIAVIVAVVGAGGFLFFKNGQDKLYNVGQVNYVGKNIAMTKVANAVQDGKVIISLENIKSSNIIFTEYSNSSVNIPLTAFVTPAGDVVAAVSICEPCRGYEFHIEEDELVCNACGTRWTLDGLKGTWGGCQEYPPDQLNYEIDETGKYLLLDEQEVATWKPRPL